MAKGERSINPATAHLKLQKARALKKSKGQIQTQRQEKLARRNPERLQKQIDELKAVQEAQGGQLRPKDKQTLEQLERDIKVIRKARESLGEQGSPGDHDGRGASANKPVLGKRRRPDGHHQKNQDKEESESTDEEVRNIPMPQDTPPPIPQPRKHNRREQNAAAMPSNDKVEPVSQTVYSSAPQIRNLQKESTSKFLPSAVSARLKQSKGESGRYLEPEEVDRLEKSGYMAAKKAAEAAAKEAAFAEMGSAYVAEGGTFEEEEAAFERELEAAEVLGTGESSLTRKEIADLKVSSLKDAEKATKEAVRESQYGMMTEIGYNAVIGSRDDEERIARSHLRHVELEEVEDEDG